MRKNLKFIDAGCLTYLLCLLVVALSFGLSQDLLFFKTDPAALVHFLVASGWLLALVLFVPVALVFYFTGNAVRERCLNGFSILALGLMLFGFCVHFLDTSELFHFTLKQIQESWLPFDAFPVYGIAIAALGLLCFALAVFLARAPDIRKRVVSLSYGVTALGAVLFLLFPALSFFSASAADGKELRRNAILIVLDGLSTKYLSPYNPKENTPEFDALAASSVKYTNIRTNFTHTSGFFYTLYSGQKQSWADPKIKKQTGLLKMLQDAGVNTRWFTYHNNGVPDVHNFPYRGLRSTFLVSRFAWMPRLLNVDYNVFEMRGNGARGRAMGEREKSIHGWLSGINGDGYLHPLRNWVMDEIEALREDARPYFMVVHLPVNALTPAETAPRTWELEEADFVPEQRLQRVRQKMIRDQDYTYRKEDAWAVERLRDKYRQSVRAGGKSLMEFIRQFEARGWDADTLLMVTADHGKILSGGKIEYGYHNDEEVARVPLFVKWQGKEGIDSRLGESIDLVQTFLDFFGIEKKLSADAVSLLADAKKTRATTLTTWSFKRKEWFLNVYEGEHRYVFNLYPHNASMRKESFQGPFQAVSVAEGRDALKGAGFDMAAILKSYGIEGDPKSANDVWSLMSPESSHDRH